MPTFRRSRSMVSVVPGVWMGTAKAIRDAPRAIRLGIDRVVDLREEWEAAASTWPEPITRVHVPIVDHQSPSKAELRAAGEVVANLVRQGHEVLIHCHAGIERTPTVACAALMLMGWPLRDAYQRIVDRRPESAPTEGQLAVLQALATELGRP